jgi:hypothetical protein
MGEWMEVASAKRGVRTGFNERSEDEELDEKDREGVRLRAAGRLFSSMARRDDRWEGSALPLQLQLQGRGGRQAGGRVEAD